MKLFISILFCSILFFTSCKNDCENNKEEIKTIMRDWYKKKIIFPQNMEVLKYNPTTNNENQTILKKYTIVHFFTADCDKCINELLHIKSFLEKNPSKNIDYIFIASAPTKIYVSDAIKKIKFPYPIYYEKQYYSFKTINKLPLSDNIFDTMLLNKNQEVILFGAFYDNEKAERLYSKTVECNL
ncbi:MAG: hypothetical protein QM564_00625 [Bergeyella sp.]